MPIDVCYELVGEVRLSWTGLGGGAEVWQAIGEFFDGARRASPARVAIIGWVRMTEDPLPGIDLDFACLDVVADRYAAGPTVLMKMRATDTGGARVHAVALRCQVRVEPVRRSYGEGEAAKVVDLFGDRTRWGSTMQPMQLAFLSQVLPTFTGSCDFDLVLPLSYDVEVAAHKYLAALEEGEVPLILLFSGTVFSGALGQLSVQPVPWHKETQVRMPVVGLARGDGRALPRPGVAAPEPGGVRRPGDVPRQARAGRLGRRGGEAAAGGGARDEARLTQARAVADAVLYEGYVLYPYRASAPKNQVRWQWGVLMPPDAVAAGRVGAGVVPDGGGGRRRGVRRAGDRAVPARPAPVGRELRRRDCRTSRRR